jgi:hypothetical protein
MSGSVVPEPGLPTHLRLQRDFAGHIRDPDNTSLPADVENRRMKIYRELFYNNIESFLANGFPVLKSLLRDDQWHAMVRDFMRKHRCESPLFAEIPQEFLAYLQHERGEHADDPPYLLELTHYEWVELDVEISDETVSLSGIDPNGDLLRRIPVVSSVAWNLAYAYPVHRISPDFQPQEPGDTPSFLVVYRDRDDEVHFLEINALTHRLLQVLKENETATGLDLLKGLAVELQAPDVAVIIDAGASLLEDLRDRNILLGTRKL